jgi:AcrR family transcriptional regulator
MDDAGGGGRTQTRLRLLKASELLIVREGVHALTIRRIAAAANANSALIGYHFGGVDGLLSELARLNGEAILTEQARRFAEARARPSVERLLEAFLRPLWREAALNPGERALVVVDEIVSRAEPELRRQVWTRFAEAAAPFHDALASLLPALAPDQLRWRLRFLSAAALDMPPRSARGALAPPEEDEGAAGGEEARIAEFLAFARGALLAPPADTP